MLIHPPSEHRPLRILHYVPALWLEQGGVVRAILDWATVLAARGHQMSLCAYHHLDVPADWLDGTAGKPRAFLVPKPSPPFKQLSRKAMAMIKAELLSVDVLHLHGPWLDGNRQIAHLARRMGVPYVVSIHGMLDDWAMQKRGWKKRLYMSLAGRRTLNGASCIHCTAAAELDQAKKWFDNPRTVVLPALIDLSPFENLPGRELAMQSLPESARDQPKLLFLSRLHEQKGIDILIRAAGILAQRRVKFILLLAGTGAPAYIHFLKTLVEALKLQDRVNFLGHLNGAHKISMIQTADLFVVPTRHENFGLALVEAMAIGTPLLTTKGTDIWQELQSGGAVIAEATPEAFAEKIEQLINNDQDRTARGHQGRSWVFSALSTEKLVTEYEAFYRRLCFS